MTSSSIRSANFSDDYQEESGLLDSQTAEDQLVEAFDSLTAKSAKTRLVAFELIRKTLSQRYMVDFVFSRRETIVDSISRCIKKNKGQDLSSSATLLSIICSTLGPAPETDPMFGEVMTQLLSVLSDQTIQADIRSSCARSIAICTFIIGIDGYIEQVMDRFFSIFNASCAKGDGSMPSHSDSIALLHSVCLQGWTLLLTAVSNFSEQIAVELVEEQMDKITELLDSPQLDVRIAAGECIAVMCEIIKSHNKDVTAEDFDDLCDKLREISTDAQKSRGKRDLRHQRSNFRDILASIEEDETPSLIIKFGNERLMLESWAKRRQYDAFCELFSAGMNHQLAENEVLRDIFCLGPVRSNTDIQRIKRSDNSYENMLAEKVRTKNLRKLRDKRAVVIN